jgi:sugar (pentulose or hexulose) kinase
MVSLVPDLLIGVDVGTSSVKAALCTAEGREVAHGSAALTWSSTSQGTETDPARVLAAVRAALNDALASAPEGRIAGLGVASMAEAGVYLGPDDRPVAPLIAWHDSRDREQAARLDADLGAETFAASTGLPLGTQWSLTKHRWLHDHGHAERAVRRLNVAEWIVYALGGEPASELSLASRTGWFHLRDRAWWEPALEWSGMDPALLPPTVRAGTPLGRAAADRAGDRLAGAVLTLAGHDHLAAAVGAEATGDGGPRLLWHRRGPGPYGPRTTARPGGDRADAPRSDRGMACPARSALGARRHPRRVAPSARAAVARP